MTYFNLINPFILTPSLSFLLVWAVKICIFYPLLFWGTFKHLGRYRIPFIFYLVLAMVAFFLPFNFFLNDLILCAIMISLYYFFVNHNDTSLTGLVATFSFALLLNYLAQVIASSNLGLFLNYFNLNGSPFYFVILNLIVLACYGTALLLVMIWRPFFNHYLTRLNGQHPLVQWFFSLAFLPLSYFLYYCQYNKQLNHPPVPPYNSAPFWNVITFQLVCLGYVLLITLVMELVSRYLANRDRANFADYRLTNLIKYTSQLEVMNDDLRRFKHDYKNILYSLSSALETNNLDYAKQALKKLTNATRSNIDIPTGIIGPLKNIRDTGLKAVVFNKVSTALNLGLNLRVEIADPIDLNQALAPVDAIRIVAILLDNAIQAAKDSPDHIVSLSLYENRFAQFIVVGNSTNHQVNLTKLRQFSHTVNITHSHHLGLRNLQIILARYPDASNDQQAITHWFEQKVIIPKH